MAIDQSDCCIFLQGTLIKNSESGNQRFLGGEFDASFDTSKPGDALIHFVFKVFHVQYDFSIKIRQKMSSVAFSFYSIQTHWPTQKSHSKYFKIMCEVTF